MDIRELTRRDIAELYTALHDAHRNGRTVRVAWDGALKVKVGEGMWTAPLGEPEGTPQAYDVRLAAVSLDASEDKLRRTAPRGTHLFRPVPEALEVVLPSGVVITARATGHNAFEVARYAAGRYGTDAPTDSTTVRPRAVSTTVASLGWL